MLKRLADALISSLLGLGVFGLGLWLLYLAFLNSNVVQGVGGGLLVLLGMWLMTRARGLHTGPGP